MNCRCWRPTLTRRLRSTRCWAGRVNVIRRERSLVGRIGETISLFAMHGPALGVVTQGLRYPLCGETLGVGSGRGTSNAFTGTEAHVAVKAGVLLAIRAGSA